MHSLAPAMFDIIVVTHKVNPYFISWMIIQYEIIVEGNVTLRYGMFIWCALVSIYIYIYNLVANETHK